MVTRKRNKWKGWIKEEDVAPETLEKFRRYYEVYKANDSGVGCGSPDYMKGHRIAEQEVPMTKEEKAIMKRLDPFGTILGHKRVGE